MSAPTRPVVLTASASKPAMLDELAQLAVATTDARPGRRASLSRAVPALKASKQAAVQDHTLILMTQAADADDGPSATPLPTLTNPILPTDFPSLPPSSPRSGSSPHRSSPHRSSSDTARDPAPTTQLMDLPEELQQLILSLLLGNLRSTSAAASSAAAGARDGHGTRDWSRALRHPRTRTATDLALVSRTWRTLVQERLYRHGEPIHIPIHTASPTYTACPHA